MKYEIKQNHYIVAGHSFTIEADEMILNKLSEYEPFRDEAQKEDVFKMTIKTSSPNLNTKMIVDNQWELDNTSSISGHTSDGHFFFKYQWQHKPIACLITDQQYTRGTAYLTGYEPTLAINMAMMVLYRHATAHLMTTIIHTSAIAYKQHAYLFIGLSGTGKSTHSQLWLSNINDTSLINDDKPVIRIHENGEIMLYGSPWSGKLKCYRNVSYPVGAIVKLKQAPYNKISKLNKIEAYVALLHCIYGKRWEKSIADALHNIECILVDTLPIYQLECLPDKEAALLCKETITENI